MTPSGRPARPLRSVRRAFERVTGNPLHKGRAVLRASQLVVGVPAGLGLVGWIEVVAAIVRRFTVQKPLTAPGLHRLWSNTQHVGHLVPCEIAPRAEPLVARQEFVGSSHVSYAEASERHATTGVHVAC